MTSRRSLLLVSCLAALVLSSGCMSLDVDLDTVPVPVSAQSDDGSETTSDAITLQAKHVLYAHGLLGESRPDVGDMVAEASRGYDRVAGFRVTHGAGFHDWLVTHLTLTLVRMKTVTVHMERIR